MEFCYIVLTFMILKVRKTDQAFLAPDSSRHEGPELRQIVLSQIAAWLANEEPDVKDFRASELNGKLIAHSQVEQWIHEKATQDSRLQTPRIQEVLNWLSPGDVWAHAIPLISSGVLERVHVVCAGLARRFKWDKAQASVFLLTGLIPRIRTARISWNHGLPIGFSRIELDLDPALKPSEVAEIYRTAQRQMIGNRKRQRAPGPDHLKLAEFYVANKTEELGYKELMKLWNSRHRHSPDRQYRTVSHFGTDCKKVLDRLLLKAYSREAGL
jgi:hypothetical protein